MQRRRSRRGLGTGTQEVLTRKRLRLPELEEKGKKKPHTTGCWQGPARGERGCKTRQAPGSPPQAGRTLKGQLHPGDPRHTDPVPLSQGFPSAVRARSLSCSPRPNTQFPSVPPAKESPAFSGDRLMPHFSPAQAVHSLEMLRTGTRLNHPKQQRVQPDPEPWSQH